MKRTLFAGLLGALALFAAPSVRAQDGPIQDNSFLLEEAYNQETRVVQHIFTWQRAREGDWDLAFTQEWPFLSQKHQLSYTIPFAFREESSETRFANVALNYRYQLIGSGQTALAVAPRFSVYLGTGDETTGHGSRATAFELGLPVSWAANTWLVTHVNTSFRYTPSDRNAEGDRARTVSTSVGASAVFLLHPKANVFVEALFTGGRAVIGPGTTDREQSATINPGARFAIDLGRLQIVPGISFPIGFGPSSGERGVFLYLSLEHPF